MTRPVQTLLWIAGAIAVSVAVAWALTTNHSHSELATQTELNRVHDRLKEMHGDLKGLMEKLYADPSR